MSEDLKAKLLKTFSVFLWTITSVAAMGLVSYLASGEVNPAIVAWSPLLNTIAYGIYAVAIKKANEEVAQ